jgi:hypothetical protein
MIRADATRSYYHTKVSPKSLIEKMQLARIAIELVDANRLISAKGSIRTWIKLAMRVRKSPPRSMRAEHHGLAFFPSAYCFSAC